MRPPARCPCDAQAPLSLPLSRISRPRRRPAPPWSLSPPRRFPSSLTRLSLPLGIQAEQPCAVRRSSAASGMSGDLGLCLVWEAEMRERGLCSGERGLLSALFPLSLTQTDSLELRAEATFLPNPNLGATRTIISQSFKMVWEILVFRNSTKAGKN